MTEIATMDQWESVLGESTAHPVMIYKHSTTCPISASAQRRLLAYEKHARETGAGTPPISIVRVHESRAVSNAIAERLGVAHQSPQLLLLIGGRCAWNTSHYDITAENIEKALEANAV